MDRERFFHPKRGGRGIGRGRVVTRGFRGRGRGAEGRGYDSCHDRGARSMESLAELSGWRQMPGAQDGWRQIPGAQDGCRPMFGDQARWKPNFAPRGGSRRNQEIHNDPAKEEQHATGFKKQRKYPISVRDLDRLTTLQPDLVVLELLSEKSGFSLLVEQNDITPLKYDLAIKVLARATTCQSIRESVYELLNKTLTEGFAAKLISYSVTVKRLYPEKGRVFFADLHTVMETFCNGMMSIAINRLINLVDTCHSALTTLEAEGQVEDCMVKKYKILLDRLTEAAKKWEPENKIDEQDSRKRRVAEMDNMEPPDDFRELSVLPTSMDIVDTKRPFLRRNVVKGRYTDGQHYLDVQFRLLREDFVRPLREGICQFRSNTKSRIMDVRIYRNVTYIGSKLQHHRIFHGVKLGSLKTMKLENSKRLMYGNLVCFSNDNFATMILGSVADRSPEALKEGIIGIEFESDISEFDMSGNFTMVESRAYFMAYKHVLQALKEMPNNIPMEKYVVHVEGLVNPPRYLGVENPYDLRVIRSKSMMKNSEAFNRFFREELAEAQEEVAQDVRHLEKVQIARDLAEWPSADDLGLDSSQRRALHSALTRELAIIQGPPGTGKTYLGLKIVQTLLHNSQVWKDKDNPILVVCFTNHALDQFLEGMTTFTNSIVRVGSRTKSETIEKYQINKLVQSVVSSRSMPHCIHSQKANIISELRHLENGIGMCRQVDIECGAARGIFSLNVFASSNIIPNHILQQLEQAPNVEKLMYWLALSCQSQNVSRLGHQVDDSTAKKQKASQQQTDAKLGYEVDEDKFRDAVEFLEIEERDRMIDEDDCEEPNWKNSLTKINQVTFEVTKEKLEHELAHLDAILQEEENDAASLQYIIREGQLNAMNYGLEIPVNRQEMEALETQATLNIWKLDHRRKWQLYNHWVAKLQRNARPQCQSLSALLQRRTKALEGVKNAEYLHAMRRAAVVGMTTTGAAQYNRILQDLAPSIVVIEEAAEILESHVITSLTAGCQHLIMIGDHQQLQPSATVYELAKKYGLETSLFERLIKNGLAFETLEYQHRMRPSISSLLVPSIYPTLKDHPSVHKYPPVLGIVPNIFFIAHQELERKESDDNNSHENQHEAEFMMGLCRHLVLQGYSSDDITILTAYSDSFSCSGRLGEAQRLLQRQEHICTGVKICVVDNYQGEENKIILLSLVRSNPEGSVGFLRTENRVCVALSRAKHGLYITGNMELLSQSSDLWKKINADLIKSESVGKALPLRCENHVHLVSMVSTGQDFLAKSPEGGCLQVCAKPLPQCRHCCPKACHMNDLEHVKYKCQVQCPKSLCSLDHKCPKLCWEDCGLCMVILAKDLPCSHVHSIACHVDPSSYKCPTKVVKVIPACQHEVTMPCCQDPSLFLCPEDCDTRLDCGHKCKKKCHRTRDPDHQKYVMEQCTRINVGCSQNHPCLKRCYQECGSCVVLVNKELPCRMRQRMWM
ncbi:NFX1-type zinc finger-containing protein 1 [Chionoecetes opilio]|uniref:NFX1-type zinc finger-containing protein 1 n=1 Tax=Chionoecetes opilio TaxID=41210 RepID=A0A8J4YEF3_CHIOP|nr:NFX1-type zinc finger-containing protein 1 [Chionoecetes opilio]